MLETLIGGLLGFIFTIFSIEEEQQIKFISRLVKICSISFLSFFIYQKFYGNINILPFEKWEFNWFETIQFNHTLYCIFWSLVILYLLKYLIKRFFIFLFEKAEMKIKNEGIKFLRFLHFFIIAENSFVKNILVNKKYLKKKGNKTTYTERGQSTLRGFVKFVDKTYEDGGYDCNHDYYDISSMLILIICISYNKYLETILVLGLFLFILKAVAMRLLSKNISAFIKSINNLKIIEHSKYIR